MTPQGAIYPSLAYQAYGMTVLSEIPLPELSPSADTIPANPVIIRYGRVPVPPEASDQAAWFHFTDDSTLLHWRDVGSFLVSDHGRLITVSPAKSVDPDLIAFPLLGPVLSDCLRRTGLFVLHASAVSLGGAAVCLMADKGTGKSTTASALLESGGLLLADDLVALQTSQMAVVPGFGQIKLSESALHRLKLSGVQKRPHVHDAIDKIRVMVPQQFVNRAVPLRRTYALIRDPSITTPMIEPVSKDEILPIILRYAYAARFGRDGLTGIAAATHFRDAVALSQSGTVRRLVVPENLGGIGKIVEAIRHDLHSDLQPTPASTGAS